MSNTLRTYYSKDFASKELATMIHPTLFLINKGAKAEAGLAPPAISHS